MPTFRGKRIASAGNIYRHGYDAVVTEVLWQTVRTGLTELRRAVEAKLAQHR
jgi:uncharacterized protein with HEPN domain